MERCGKEAIYVSGRGRGEGWSGPVSRVLFRGPLARSAAMTISLGRRLPGVSSSRPGSGCETGRFAPARGPVSFLLGLAPDGVYQAGPVTRSAGELLPHRFTLTGRRTCRRSVFCGTVPGLTAGGRYPPSRPLEPGLSSRRGIPCRWPSRAPVGLSRPTVIRSPPIPLPELVTPNRTSPAEAGAGFDRPVRGT